MKFSFETNLGKNSVCVCKSVEFRGRIGIVRIVHTFFCCLALTTIQGVCLYCCELTIGERMGGLVMAAKSIASYAYRFVVPRWLETKMAVLNYDIFLREISPSCLIASAGKGGLLELLSIYSGGSRMRISAGW